MAKRRGLLGRLINAVFGRREVAQPPPSAPPKPPAIGPLRQRALSHFMSLIPMAKRSTVENGINAMSIDELMWTIKATAAQIRDAAGQDADRLAAYLDGSYKPLNPWWYG